MVTTLALTTPKLQQAQTQGKSQLILEAQSNPKHRDYEILHATSGRIRVGIPKLAYDLEYAEKLKYVLSSVTGITDVRINAWAKSVIIHYHSQPAWEEQMRESILESIDIADTLIMWPVAVAEELDAQIANSWDWLMSEFGDVIKQTGTILLKIGGTVCLVVGIIGLFAPLIPGTPFLILASLCFLGN